MIEEDGSREAEEREVDGTGECARSRRLPAKGFHASSYAVVAQFRAERGGYWFAVDGGCIGIG